MAQISVHCGCEDHPKGKPMKPQLGIHWNAESKCVRRKPYECLICDKLFKTKSAVFSHIRHKHAEGGR